MPPGEVIARGEKPGGGKTDFCWLVLDRTHSGAPTMWWLHQDDPQLPSAVEKQNPKRSWNTLLINQKE
jgi:hypothetical protein